MPSVKPEKFTVPETVTVVSVLELLLLLLLPQPAKAAAISRNFKLLGNCLIESPLHMFTYDRIRSCLKLRHRLAGTAFYHEVCKMQ